ncbi:unnamed protein product, partial [Meganyctiphanes norvegica]
MRDHHTPTSGHHTHAPHPHDQADPHPSTTQQLERSDSYCLSRGGKLVSSKSWEEHPPTENIFFNMHALDGRSREGLAVGQQVRPSSGGTSSDTGGDTNSASSSSSSSDESSEEEYNVATPSRAAPRHMGHANPYVQEVYQANNNKTLDDSDAIPGVFVLKCHGEAEGAGVKQRQPGDGHPHPSGLLDAYHEEEHDPAHGDLTPNTSHDMAHATNSDTDSDCDTDETETESTVRARMPEVLGVEDPGGGGSQEGDHNDTLSTLSGDLSFDDRDVSSPVRDLAVDGPHTQVSALRRGMVEPDEGIPRPPPEGEHGSGSGPSEPGVSAGIFCITGYAKGGVPVSLTSISPDTVENCVPGRTSERRRQEDEDKRRSEEIYEMHRAEASHREILQRMEREAQEIREEEEQVRRDEVEAEEGKRGGGMAAQHTTHFPPNYLSGHSRVAHLRGTWDLTQTPPTPDHAPTPTPAPRPAGAMTRSPRKAMQAPTSHPHTNTILHQQDYVQSANLTRNENPQRETTSYKGSSNSLALVSRDAQFTHARDSGRRSPLREVAAWQPPGPPMDTMDMLASFVREDLASGRRSVDSLVPMSMRDVPQQQEYGVRSMDRSPCRRETPRRTGRSSVDNLWSQQQRRGSGGLSGAIDDVRPSPRGHHAPQTPTRTPHQY